MFDAYTPEQLYFLFHSGWIVALLCFAAGCSVRKMHLQERKG